jgi:hypothetical protein
MLVVAGLGLVMTGLVPPWLGWAAVTVNVMLIGTGSFMVWHGYRVLGT